MYPKHLTKDLPSIEGKLISCLAKDISLFQEFPESITIDNFTSEENRIFFKVYKTLYEKKYSTIDEVSINSEFPQGSKDRQLFESYHGSALTKEFKNNELSAIENFDKFKGDFLEVKGVKGVNSFDFYYSLSLVLETVDRRWYSSSPGHESA